MASTRFNRVLLKVGGESLIGDRPYGIDPKAAMKVAAQIKAIYVENECGNRISHGWRKYFPGYFRF